MDEILRHLPEGACVLDLGSGAGSFDAEAYPVVIIRADLDSPRRAVANFVRCDAARLPFHSGAFSAVISNHSLEHFMDLESALREIGRVIEPGGSFYAAVPDASTITDRIYRWLAKGGGHVNPFTSAERLIGAIEAAAGLKHVAMRPLCTSLSFLNRRTSGARPRKKLLLGGGYEWSLRLMTFAFRLLDRMFGTRASIYGWAMYFGALHETIDVRAWTNVCIRCGAGHPSRALVEYGRVKQACFFIRRYDCLNCGATNLFTDD